MQTELALLIIAPPHLGFNLMTIRGPSFWIPKLFVHIIHVVE